MLSLIAPLKPIISALILPPGLTVLTATLGLLLLLRSRRRTGLALLMLSTAGFWLGQSVAVARWMQVAVIDIPPALTRTDLVRLQRSPVPTAIIVLGGGAYPGADEYEGQPVLSESSFLRLRYGAFLARETGLPMGYSGGVGWAARAGAAPETEAAALAVKAWGLTLRWTESESRDTRENARMTVPLLQQSGIQELVLVTEAAHMPRALRAFREAAGESLHITPAPTGFIKPAESRWVEWLPSSRGQRLINFMLHEWVGMLVGA